MSSFYFYEHGQADTEPVNGGSTTDNIIGLELEVSEVLDYSDIDYYIDTGYIEADGTEWAPVVIEEEAQGDIEIELIFRADTPENIIKRVREIADIRDNQECAENTSAHIHLNRRYIESEGLSEIDIYKAAEAVAPVIYNVSGRNYSSWREWTPSRIDIQEDIKERFNLIDNITPKNTGEYNNRYELCNCTNSATIEIRGFSNYYNFNINKIELYIKIVSELIPELAQLMKERSYKKDWETAFKCIDTFIKDNFLSLNVYDINILLKERQERAQAIYKQYDNILTMLDGAELAAPLKAAEMLIKALQTADPLEIEINNINLKNIEETLTEVRRQALNWYISATNNL